MLSSMRKEMDKYAKSMAFEKAAKVRDQIKALENVFSHKFGVRSSEFETNSNLKIKNSKTFGFRISDFGFSSLEAYDISNIQGKEPVASMVRFSAQGGPASGWAWKPNKSMYRKFKIRLRDVPNDVGMLREVMRRRLAHLEWPYPDVFLIDGGRGQLNAALSELKKITSYELRVTASIRGLARRRTSYGPKVIALAKRFNELYIPNRRKPIPLDTLPRDVKNLLMYARDEAHRFAITYHRKLHRRIFE